jgi:hypothetical protein
VIPNSPYLIADTIVVFVDEFSVPNVQQTQFLPHLAAKGILGTSGKRFAYAIFVTSNGRRV